MQTNHLAPKPSWSERYLHAGALELFLRRIRADTVRARFHLSCGVAILAPVILLFVFTERLFFRGSPTGFGINMGHILFHAWTWTGLAGLVGGAIKYVSFPICEEKEQGTLGLLKLTGIGAGGLVQYFLGYGFLQAMIILILNLPALGFILTLGGVSYQQILLVVLTLGATSFLAASLAFWIATASNNRQTAQGLFVAFMFLYGMAILSLNLISSSLRQYASGSPSPLMLNVAEWSTFTANGLIYFFPPVRLYEILTFGYGGGLPLLYLAFCLLAGLALLWWSERIFETHSDHIEPQKTELKRGPRTFSFLRSRPAFQPRQQKYKGPTSRRSDRCWENPFVWREFQFQKGGWKSVAASAITSLLVFLLIVVLIGVNLNNPGPFQNAFGDALFGFSSFWLFICILGTVLAAAILLGTVLSSEIKGKTLGTLFLVSRPPLEIIRELARGRLLLLTHAITPFLLGLGGLAVSALLPSTVWSQPINDPWSVILIVGIAILALPLIAYLGYFFSLVSIRFELIRSDLTKKIFIIIISIFFFMIFPLCFGILLSLSFTLAGEITRTILLFGLVALGFLLSIILLPKLRLSIERAIHKRMADE